MKMRYSYRMKSKTVKLLLSLTFLFLFSCSEKKSKTEFIENPKVRVSFFPVSFYYSSEEFRIVSITFYSMPVNALMRAGIGKLLSCGVTSQKISCVKSGLSSMLK